MRFVDRDWIQGRLGSPEVQVYDPRLRVRYTSGHLEGAIHVPVAKAFDPAGRLLADEPLVRWLEGSGVRTDVAAVVYDQGDAQAGAMLAWVLEYVGHPDVRFMSEAFEHWRTAGCELFYRPVRVDRGRIELRPRRQLRATWRDLVNPGEVNIIDARSVEEFTGETTIGEDPPGHVPGATNLPWFEFTDGQPDLFVSPERVHRLFKQAKLQPAWPTFVYCRVGMRAAVVVMALLDAGYQASLYDGSWLDWSSHDDLQSEVSTQPGLSPLPSGRQGFRTSATSGDVKT